MKKIIIINIKYYLNYIIGVLNEKKQMYHIYHIKEKRKLVFKSNWERNKIVEVDCQGTKKNNNKFRERKKQNKNN